MPSAEKWKSDDRTVERRDADRGAADPPADTPEVDREVPEGRDRSIISTPGVGSAIPAPKEVE